jgi:hypothetical protein
VGFGDLWLSKRGTKGVVVVLVVLVILVGFRVAFSSFAVLTLT